MNFHLIRFPKRCPDWLMTLLVTTYLLLVFNSCFFATVAELQGLSGLQNLTYLGSLFLLLPTIINLFLTLVAIPWLLKPVTILILISAAFAAYFMQTYNVMIDKTMIQNMMETDVAETSELVNSSMLLYICLSGLLPALLIAKIKISYGSPLQFALGKIAILMISATAMALISISFYQDYASLFRNHRYVRNLIVPVNYIYALQAWGKQKLPQQQAQFQLLGEDAQLGPSWTSANPKRVVTVLIVGETARSANFSLFDYARNTTPRLAQQDLIRFSNFYACGTSTAVSVPCMFSNLNRSEFDNYRANQSENLLDVLQRAGLRVKWIDNNSGCKGVCDRVESDKLVLELDSANCVENECFDMGLIGKLQQTIDASERDMVVVLHQKGSHGPAYFMRTPKQFQQFIPVCHTNQLQECSQQEIINAYDNTILYTDYFVSAVIDYLKNQQESIDASLIYLSDHGESLGEHNIYLHGLPYMLAPEEQTHVPLLVWMADDFADRFAIDKGCLQGISARRFEHDNLFDSILGLLDVRTSAYRQQQDIFSGCHSPAVIEPGNSVAAGE
ncbi:phosphoethanolamine--lipid A transferase [Pseudomaricurvus alcaniphilus]|uniref:phosphoethanolamine transferase n=1 Tax=Pseudomaricurvus alcaniphilus TaxID=1166482 RepID=UPI00140AB1F9|nr:phosphoethanolamine--lipid A transferase [Pseudomaricurvus alcaniphilus]NHN38504.1 phosphoethanolamine--lipid A transferase [Pseudomaricurvus alcaniphilus]